MLGRYRATTIVGMYFRYKNLALPNIYVAHRGKSNQQMRICLVECSLAPVLSFGLHGLVASHASCWALAEQQQPLARV